jgi:hypothetical protein
VEVRGPLKAVGITPFWAPRFPIGSYKIAVSRKGYYTRSTSILLNRGDSLHVSARLKEKPRYMGFVRSLVLPGWGQRFNERPVRGAFYTGAEAVAGGVAIYLATQYNHSATRYKEIADSLNAATTVEALTLYSNKLLEHQVSFEHHYNQAFTAAMVAAGIWGLSALDALVFGPVREPLPEVSLDAAPAPNLLGLAGNSADATSRMALTVRF